MSRFYITTAIPYANGAPHIGHAYERIATDAIQRFMRLDGRETLFVTGMDEHGLKVQQTAAREGVSPQAFVDRIAAEFEAMGDMLNARADDIVRTTQPRNDRAAQAIWERMAANGDIYLSKYSGWYSVRDEAYFDDGELTEGPDGTKLAPSGAPVEWVEEESYFFRLSAYAERLLAHYEAHPEFVTPETYRNEIIAFVKRGLADLSISRATFDWGTPVPGDPKHVMYVWVDALTNYITATGFPDDGPRAKFWPADAHVIGKDITRFHAIYWPAFLMSAGLPVPKQVVVHGFLFNRGEKMSKSVGNVVEPERDGRGLWPRSGALFLPARGPVRPGRQLFARGDRHPHERRSRQRHRQSGAALAHDDREELRRTGSGLAQRDGSEGRFGDAGAGGRPRRRGARVTCRASRFIFMSAAVFEVVSEANRYFANAEPWRLAKTDPARMGLVLYVTIETLRIAAILLQPVMPGSMGALLDLLAVGPKSRAFAAADAGAAAGRLDAPHRLEPGRALPRQRRSFRAMSSRRRRSEAAASPSPLAGEGLG